MQQHGSAEGGSPVWRSAAAAARPQRGGWTLELPGGEPMFFRRVPADIFHMGSRGRHPDEEPRHRLRVPKDFYLGTFVVTQAQYRGVAELAGDLDDPEPSDFKGERRPVETVSWDDATAWCRALAQACADGLPPDAPEVRLPTEAEWEFACRGGAEDRPTEYWNGDGEAALAQVGWYAANSGQQTHAVDEIVGRAPEAHPLGLFGMHGNVWEWCADVWDADAYKVRADGAPALRVTRELAVNSAMDPRFVAATRLIRRIASDERAIAAEDRAALEIVLAVVIENAKTHDSWKGDPEVVQEALDDAEWPADKIDVARGIAQAFESAYGTGEESADPPRVMRGGSWGFSPDRCRAAFRSGGAPGNRGRDQGFRVCLSPQSGGGAGSGQDG